MNTVLHFFLSVLLLTGCSKENDGDVDTNIDMTAYYIPCKTTYRIAGNSFQMASAFTFKPLAQGALFYPGGGNEAFEYQLRDGRLNLTNGNLSWRLENESISDFTTSNTNFSVTEYELVKLPDTDAFTGKDFMVNGTVTSVNHQNGNGSNVPLQEFNGLRFANGKFFVRRTGGETEMGNYTLQNNGIATARTGGAGTLWLFVIDGGTLHFSSAYQDRTQFASFGELR